MVCNWLLECALLSHTKLAYQLKNWAALWAAQHYFMMNHALSYCVYKLVWVVWFGAAQKSKVQSWAVCIHSSHANTHCVLVLFEVLTESCSQSINWWFTGRRNFYHPIFLVQVHRDCAIMEVWLSFHDICRTWSHCKHRAGTSSRASRDLALPLLAPNILPKAMHAHS